MVATSKKSLRSTRRNTKSAKILISTIALAATFGGWVAMSANDGSVPVSPLAQIISTSQISIANGLNPQLVDGAPASAQPPAPIAVTRSSR